MDLSITDRKHKSITRLESGSWPEKSDKSWRVASAHGSDEGSFWETKTNIAEQIYTKQVGEPAVVYSVLSVAQACAELTRLYPSAYELIAKTTTCWNHLANDTLLGQSLWETRTKKLLGAIS